MGDAVVGSRYQIRNATVRPMQKRTIRALTGLCYCSSCGQRMVYTPGRKRRTLRCGTLHCAQRNRQTEEAELIRFTLEQLRLKAPRNLAASVVHEPASARALRAEIDQLLSLKDPDLCEVIARKRDRLNELTANLSDSNELIARIEDPDWMKVASYDEATMIIHSLVRQIRVTKQVPEAVHLRL